MGSQIRKPLFSVLMAAFTLSSAAAAPKSNSFSQTFTLYSYNCSGQGWCTGHVVQDGGFFLFNPNSTDLSVRSTLTAVNNPSFQFNNGQTGTFNFPDLTLSGYADCVNHPGFVAQQMLGPYGIGAIGFDARFTETTFQLNVWSVSGAPFYLYGPGDGFLVSGSTRGGSFTAAYYNAWKGFDRQIPVTWDAGVKGWVAPFANFWHNRSDWPEGWQTTVTITQPAYAFSHTYTIRNIGQSGGHGHSETIPSFGCCSAVNPPLESSGVCAANQFRTMCTNQYIFSFSSPVTVTLDAYRFHISEQNGFVSADHDRQLVVKIDSNSPGATSVSVRVLPNVSGQRDFCP